MYTTSRRFSRNPQKWFFFTVYHYLNIRPDVELPLKCTRYLYGPVVANLPHWDLSDILRNEDFWWMVDSKFKTRNTKTASLRLAKPILFDKSWRKIKSSGRWIVLKMSVCISGPKVGKLQRWYLREMAKINITPNRDKKISRTSDSPKNYPQCTYGRHWPKCTRSGIIDLSRFS